MRTVASVSISLLVVARFAAAQVVDRLVVTDFGAMTGAATFGPASAAPTIDGNVLRMTQCVDRFSSSAIRATELVPLAGLRLQLSWRIGCPDGFQDATGETGGDGFAVSFASTATPYDTSPGNWGRYIVLPSARVSIRFNTFKDGVDASSNSIELWYLDAQSQPVRRGIAITPRFDDGQLWHAWVEESSSALEVRVSQSPSRPVTPTLVEPVTIRQVIGTESASIAVGAIVGAASGQHDLVSLSIQSSPRPVSITEHPYSVLAGAGQTVQLHAQALSDSSIAWQWQHGTTPLTDDARVSGSASHTLTITGILPSDAGDYVAKASSAGTIVLTTPAMVSVNQHPPTWLPQSGTGTVPRARDAAAMTFDSARQVVVLFGGATGEPASPSTVLGDTWIRSGTEWSEKSFPSGAPAPPARVGAAAAFLPSIGETVLFGGVGQDGLFRNDVWLFDGTRWMQGPSGPPPMRFHQMAYAEHLLSLVVVGGTPTQTWQFDGLHWTTLPTPVGLDVPCCFAMTYDTDRQVLVLHGGGTTSGVTENGDTWELAGAVWTKRTLTSASPPTLFGTAGFDSHRGKAILFRGRSSPQPPDFSELWEYDGSAWARHVTGVSPPPRRFAASAFDSSRGRLVLFGGRQTTSTSDTYFGDTWEFGDPCVNRADVSLDDSITVQDVFDFLAIWFGGLIPGADFNRDSAITVQDIFDFLTAWFQGC